MRIKRPGYLGNTDYPVKTPKVGAIQAKLAEIAAMNRANSTPLSGFERTQRIMEHLKNPRKLSQGT